MSKMKSAKEIERKENRKDVSRSVPHKMEEKSKKSSNYKGCKK